MAATAKSTAQQEILALLWARLEAALDLSTASDATSCLSLIEILCKEAAALALAARLMNEQIPELSED